MLQCSATVAAIDAEGIDLDVSPVASCEACSKGFGCGMQLLDRSTSHTVHFSLHSVGLAARGVSRPVVGQRVALVSAGSAMLGASLRVYLLPLISAVTVAALASMFPFGGISADLMALLGLLTGLTAGLLVNRLFLASSTVQLQLLPVPDTEAL